MESIEFVSIGELSDPRIAQAFIDYLYTLKLQAKIKQKETSFIILVDKKNEDFCLKEFKQFAINPFAEKYRQASWSHGSTSPFFSYGTPLKNIWLHFISETGVLNLIVIAMSLFAYIGINIGFSQFFGNFTFDVSKEIWRLLTPSLLHVSLLTIAINLVLWWYVVSQLEKYMGFLSLLNVVVIIGVLSNVAQYYFNGPIFFGLSGIVFGLISFLFQIKRRHPNLELNLPDALLPFIIILTFMGFIGLGGNSMAELVGILVGLLLGLLINIKSEI